MFGRVTGEDFACVSGQPQVSRDLNSHPHALRPRMGHRQGGF